jgi:hypothetical protein
LAKRVALLLPKRAGGKNTFRLNLSSAALRVSRCALCSYMVGGGAWSKLRVAIRTREIYRSTNGDRWLLARDPDTDRVFVRHELAMDRRSKNSCAWLDRWSRDFCGSATSVRFGMFVADLFKPRCRLEAENLFSVINSASPWGVRRRVFDCAALTGRC